MASLVEALIQQESGGNPNALNRRTGAMGLMQVMPATAANPGFGIRPLTNPWDASENRRFGTDYLTAMLKRYGGDRDAALAAYNWGPGNADKWVASGKTAPLPGETRNYIRNINAMTDGGQPSQPQQQPQAGGQAMNDPFEQLWGPQPMRRAPTGGAQQPTPEGGMGYFGRMFQDTMFLMGASVLGGGLAGQDFGTAAARGAQSASAIGQMHDKRRKAAAWARLFGPNGANMDSPLLKSIPADYVPLIQNLGPEEGMDALLKLAFKRMEPEDLIKVGAGDTLVGERSRQPVYTAPAAPEKPPSGYRYAEGGGSLEAIPGGPATVVPGDHAGRLALMRTAKQDYESAKKLLGPDMSHTAKVFNYGETGGAERTVRTAIEATLRAMTGAAAPPAEVDNYERLFSPTIWDGPTTRQDKLRRLENFINEAESLLMQGRTPSVTTVPKTVPGATRRADDPLGILD
jgi:hypothetical protein